MVPAQAEQLVKAHEAKLDLGKRHDAVLAAKDAALAASAADLDETRDAFTDYMAKKQEELVARTTALSKDVDAATTAAAAAADELDQIQEAFNAHTVETDTLIEAQGDELRKVRRALQTVGGAAIAAMKEV